MNKTSVFKPDETLGETIDFTEVFGPNKAERLREFKKVEVPMITSSVDGEPAPSGWRAKTASHYWVEKFDCDGHSGGMMVLQWNPSARRWSISGNVGTGNYVDTKGWKIIQYCPLPGEKE